MPQDSSAPATKADLQALEHCIDEKLQKGFAHVHESIDQVLIGLGNIDKKLTLRLDDHEERIERLEHQTGIAA